MTYRNCDIAIVGGGVAGLSAAQRLIDRAARSTAALPEIFILEAADTLGGRTRTVDVAGTPFDTGAHWFHGRQHNAFYRWLRDRWPDLSWADDQGQGARVVNRNGEEDREFRTRLFAELEHRYLTFATENPGRDTALSTFAGTGDLADFTRFMAENWMAQDSADLVSADEFFNDPSGPGGMQLQGGVALAIDRMAAELTDAGVKILTGRQVESIRDDGATAVLSTRGETFNARAAIVTVSTGVLKAGGMAIAPAPAALDAALADLTMGSMTKICVRLRPEFFTERGIAPEDHAGVLTLDDPAFCQVRGGGEPFINILTGGRAARRVEAMDDRALDDFTAAVLDAVPQFQGWRTYRDAPLYVTRWQADPFVRGSYTALLPGRQRRDPVQSGNLIFAGEAFARHHEDSPGTMLGAFVSGRRAAGLAWRLLGRQAGPV